MGIEQVVGSRRLGHQVRELGDGRDDIRGLRALVEAPALAAQEDWSCTLMHGSAW